MDQYRNRERDFTPVEEPLVTAEEQAILDRLVSIRKGAGRTVTVDLLSDHNTTTETDVAIVEDR